MKNILIIFVALVYFACGKQAEEVFNFKDTDSIEVFLQIDSIAYKNPGFALTLMQTAYESKPGDVSLKHAYYLYYLGRISLLQKDGNNAALPKLEKALAIAELNKTDELQIKILQELAIARSKNKEPNKALQVLNKAFDIADVIDYSQKSELYIEAGWIMFELNPKSSKAKEYLKKAIDKHPDKSDSLFYAKAFHNLATLFLSNNQPDSAMYYMAKAIPVFENNEYHKTLCNAYNTLGAVYEKLDDNAKALGFYKRALEKGDSLGIETANSYANIGRFYQYSVNKPLMALDYYLEAANKPGSNKKLHLIYESIASIYENNNENKLALEYYRKAMSLKNSQMEQKYKETLNRLNVEFDVKRNKQEIKELGLELENRKLQIKNQRIWFIAIAILLLMGAAMLVLYMRQRNLRQDYEKVLLEQQLLRSQMNPHFVFNAIAVIHHLIKNEDNKLASKYLIKFSRLLRKSLENSTEQFVTIQDEIELLENYLALQKLRFTGEFEYSFSLYDEYEEDFAMIPPMLIQPFVENCVEHGIRDIGRMGEINIELIRKPEAIVCKIDDNGHGLNHKTKRNPLKNKSLSTEISQKRLAILKKNMKIDTGIEIINKEEVLREAGTQVILTIPVKKA